MLSAIYRDVKIANFWLHFSKILAPSNDLSIKGKEAKKENKTLVGNSQKLFRLKKHDKLT